ncbi:MAG: T9SS type A sorting domain-containing protein [Bacteroidales bacterium]|nr:T9SS type A sorting domain-containing protein [Bacteroidales bacterium]
MKKRFTFLLAALALLTFITMPLGMMANEGDTHAMGITQSTLLNNNASIPSISIPAQSYPVSKVTINWRYNKTIQDAVTMEVFVNNTSWGTQTTGSGTGSNYVDAEFEGTSALGDIVINFTNNTGSGTGHGTFYIAEVTLTEGASGASTNPEIQIAATELALPYTENVDGLFNVTYTNGFVPVAAFAQLYNDAEHTDPFDGDWIIVVEDMDENPNVIDYMVEANDTNNERTVYLYVEAMDTDQTIISGVFTITQAAAPATYTVTFDAGEGTFVASNDFPSVSNTVAAGTYTLPSATREGYTFDGWNIPTSSELFNGNYTVSGDVDFNAHYTENTTPSGDEQWVLTNLADLTENDVFVIVGNNGDNYAMANDKGTGSAPSAVAVTVANDAITGTVAANIQWTISGNANDGYTFYPNGSTETWLYCTKTNNGVRVGTNTNNVFTVNQNYLYNTATSRHIGIYNSQDWRCYSPQSGNVHSNIANQTFAFYKKVTGGVLPPSITAENVSIEYNAVSGEIAYTINNGVDGGTLTATTQSDWLTLPNTFASPIQFTCSTNDASTERTATVILTYAYGDSQTATKEVTVTQAHFVVDYATLPFEYDGNGTGELPTGLTATGLGTYSSSPKMKFDGVGDNLILKLNQAPTSLSYDIKGNGSGSTPWSGTFKVQTSADGQNYEDLVIYQDNLGDKQSVTLIDLDAEVRFIKWVYETKTLGNVALGNIHASLDYDIYGDVTTAELIVTPDRTCTVYSGATLNVTQQLNNVGTAADFIIEEGGQLIHNEGTVAVTMKKHINHYIGTQDNYYLIAAPFQVDPSTVNGMLDNDFDLYYFARWAPGEEWQNYKADEFFMWDGQGFLYANSVDTDLEFVGEVYPSSDDDYYYGGLYIDGSTDPFNGWSLAGNPFACNAYPVLNDGTAANFYKIDGTELVLSDEDFMRPLEGIFMQETDETTQYYFNRTAPAPIRALDLTVTKVTRGTANCDRVRVRFDQGNNFGKFQLNPDNTKLYITQGNKDFAVVRSEAQGELPVNFKAAANGNYTINVDVKNTEMGYLHLIDNLTGNDVDLLHTPSYSFEAKTTDYASRFRLVFSANNVDENAIEDAFAFISNGEIILNGVNGNTTVQVFDVTGRMINSTNGANHIATDNLTAGVYMLRLINGDNVRTQKIVVK